MDLKQHLSLRLPTNMQNAASLGPRSCLEPVHVDLDSIFFNKDTMYRHNIMRINYTTYDVRRGQDTINPRTDHRDVMVLMPLDCGEATGLHEYRYARVMGIFHANVIYGGGAGRAADYRPRRMEFLWVRWFDVVKDVPSQNGWSSAQLDQLSFRRLDREGAFGFVDPAQVLHACHIMQRFMLGEVAGKGLEQTEAVRGGKDWKAYYANR